METEPLKQKTQRPATEEKPTLAEEEAGRDDQVRQTEPLHLFFADQAMAAWVEIPESRKNTVDLSEVKKLLDRYGVVHGIYSDPVLKTLLDGNYHRFMAAAATFRLDPAACSRTVFFEQKARGTTMKKGETMAALTPEADKHPGECLKIEDVFGRIREQSLTGMKFFPVFRCGQGARVSRDSLKVVAGKSGMPWISIEGRFYVFPLLNVLEDADMRFGRIQSFSSVNISGVLTGAYPLQVGRLRAKELRDADVEAIDDIRVEIGITNSKIITQGSVRARYIRNSTIEAFGDVEVDHEIIDSRIIVSGRCRSLKGKIIASKISAKQGVTARGIGSEVAEPSVISAGREDHLILAGARIDMAVDAAEQKLRRMENEENEVADAIQTLFKKMVELKLFYDQLTQKKEKLQQIVDGREALPDEKTLEKHAKTFQALESLEKKAASTISSLKALNRDKKAGENRRRTIQKNIKNIRAGVESKVMVLAMDRAELFQYAREKRPVPQIQVTGPIAGGTVFKGLFSSLTIRDGDKNVTIAEEGADLRLIRPG
ncbi:MAG: FapA family protein [Desulfobacteraceae bacterium]